MSNIKRWEDLDLSRKVTLLNHWFYYYGGTIVTLDEIEKFSELAKTNADDIFDFILTSFLLKKTIQTNVLVGAMRADDIKGLFDVLIKYNDMDDEQKKKFDPIRCSLLEEIEGTYLNPEPPVPMNVAIIVDDGPNLGGKK